MTSGTEGGPYVYIGKPPPGRLRRPQRGSQRQEGSPPRLRHQGRVPGSLGVIEQRIMRRTGVGGHGEGEEGTSSGSGMRNVQRQVAVLESLGYVCACEGEAGERGGGGGGVALGLYS